MHGTMRQMKGVRVGREEVVNGRLTSSKAFLSWLRLSIYMAIVAVAIVLNFHLKSGPTAVGKCITHLFDESLT